MLLVFQSKHHTWCVKGSILLSASCSAVKRLKFRHAFICVNEVVIFLDAILVSATTIFRLFLKHFTTPYHRPPKFGACFEMNFNHMLWLAQLFKRKGFRIILPISVASPTKLVLLSFDMVESVSRLAIHSQRTENNLPGFASQFASHK